MLDAMFYIILFSHSMEPSNRTIRDFFRYFQPIYQLIMSFILARLMKTKDQGQKYP